MGLKNLFRNEEERGGGKGDWGIILFVRRGGGRGGGDYVNLISLIFLDFLKMLYDVLEFIKIIFWVCWKFMKIEFIIYNDDMMLFCILIFFELR